VLCATALALGGCGRKGPLDLPPTASNTAPTAQTTGSDTETERASQPSLFNSTYGTDAAPAAPKGTKKPFILDPILNSN
jgi:predicted small lipoprotein YifL